MKSRIGVFSIIVGATILLWAGYLFIIQIAHPFNFQKTIELRKNPSKIIIPPRRGNIYDRNMELIVSSTKYYQIDLDLRSIRKHASRNKITDLNPTFELISKIVSDNTSQTKKQVKKKINSYKDLNSICLNDDISETELNNIKNEFSKHKLHGLVSTYNRSSRLYTKDKLCSRFLGMVKYRDADSKKKNKLSCLSGFSGLEATYDDLLTGKYGWKETIQDAKNERIPFLYLKEKPETNGNSLILTIDLDIQEILYENLLLGLKDYEAKNGIGIIMKPDTGEIVAMSSVNKNDHKIGAGQIRSQGNMAVSFQFEPGSTIKPITALLAVENKLYREDEMIDCRDYHLKYNSTDRTITDDHHMDKLTLRDVIAKSSNVGISKIVERIGSKPLYDRMFELGFGHPTGIDLSGEKGGIFRKLRDWQGFSLHSISFGQEMSATAIQLANAYCALANNGKIIQPYIVKEVKDDSGKIILKNETKVLRTISNKKSLNKLKEYLQAVVDNGTAQATKLDYITIAGKTGTAEKKIDGKVGYSKDKYTSVFAGFFPVDKPEYVMVIIYDEPKYSDMSYYASLSAVPTFKKVLEDMLNLPKIDLALSIKKSKQEFIFAPDMRNLSKSKAISILKDKGIDYRIEGNSGGIVVNQYPAPNTSFNRKEKVVLVFRPEPKEVAEANVSDYSMPNLKGLTLRKALALAHQKSVKISVNGSGIVVNQSIAAGEKISYGEQCKVTAK